MEFAYIGPKTLKRVVSDEYVKIQADYERENPSITVGLPIPLNLDSIYKKIGFQSQADLNAFVDLRVNEYKALLRKISSQVGVGKKRKSIPSKLHTAFERINDRAGFVTHEIKEGLACYSLCDDTVILDPPAVAGYLLKLQKYKSTPGFREWMDIPLALKHELVHYDLGDSAPRIEARESLTQAILGLSDSFAAGSDQSFAEILEAISEQHSPVNDRITELEITVADEALAENYSGGRDRFLVFLRSSGSQIERGSQLYDLLQSMILGSAGKRGTLRHVKAIINEAWSLDRNVVDMLLSQ